MQHMLVRCGAEQEVCKKKRCRREGGGGSGGNVSIK